jgi:DNA repair protein RecO
MYHIHKTAGLILESSPYGESNRFFTIFTGDLGLIRATAQGVRELRSKLRYGLQDLSLVKLSFVRGKEIWRITSAEPDLSYHTLLAGNKRKAEAFARVARLLKRLLAGEEKNKRLFNVVTSGLSFLATKDLDSKQIDGFETLMVLRILHNLGYVEERENFLPFLKDASWTNELLKEVDEIKSEAVRSINQSLKESHL